VVYACVRNGGRSVAARLLTQHYAQGRVIALSAITLGCGEECPYVPGVAYRDWPVDDPADQDEFTVRRIIADLDRRVRALLRELVPDLDLPPSVLS
jgi:arsenate reductase (thioredoxin)